MSLALRQRRREGRVRGAKTQRHNSGYLGAPTCCRKQVLKSINRDGSSSLAVVGLREVQTSA